jgi:S-adenosylmethionine uptake transporter
MNQTAPDTWKGMMFGLTTFIVFSFGDTIIKYETQSHPVLECAFFAVCGGLAALILTAVLQGNGQGKATLAAFRSSNPGIQALRALCLGLEFMLVLYAFSALPMATVYTLVLSAPILTAFLSPLMTSDHFNPRVLPAILLGFAGVVVALQPGAMPIGMTSMAALLSAVFFAFGNFIVRRMDRPEPPLTFAFYPSLFTFLFAGTFMILHHPAVPAPVDILLMMVTGLCSVGGLICLGRAMQLAPASKVMPFQYAQLVWGALFGLIVFHDRIVASMMLGAALILISGLMLIFGERDRAGVPLQG